MPSHLAKDSAKTSRNPAIMPSVFARLGLVFAALLLGGCQAQKTPPLSNTPLAANQSRFPKDDLGRDIALKAPARRVVVIGPGAIETIFALGAGQKIVGRDSFANYPSAARSIRVAGDYQGPSVEPCVVLRPDLVIVQGETWDKGRVEGWQKQIGAPVAALVATDMAGVRRNFEQIGKWLGCSPQAISKLVQTLPNPPAQTAARTAFIEVGRSPLYAAGQGTLVADVVRVAGLSNAVTVKGYQPFGVESLLAIQPDYYVVSSDAPPLQVTRDLRTSPALSKLKCVQAGRVLVVKGDLLLRPGPRLAQGIQLLRRAAQK